jgi:cold shock CspA family protein
VIGTVRVYKLDRGYGFLVSRTRQIYFHISEWQEEADPVAQDRVEFSLKPSKRNGYPDEACNVRRVSQEGKLVEEFRTGTAQLANDGGAL